MTFQVFNAFINKGYDELEVIIETITEDVLSLEFSTKIPLLGQRKKVALAVREAKEKQRKSNNTAVGDKPTKPLENHGKRSHWAIFPLQKVKVQ